MQETATPGIYRKLDPGDPLGTHSRSEPAIILQQSCYRSGVAQRVPGRYVSHISLQRHMIVVSLSALRTGRLYPP